MTSGHLDPPVHLSLCSALSFNTDDSKLSPQLLAGRSPTKHWEGDLEGGKKG